MKHHMGLTQGLRLSQTMTLSPQMVMQMNLLVLPLLNFNAEIETLAEDNPVLEVQQPTEDGAEKSATDASDQKEKENEEWDEKVLQRIAELGDDPGAGGDSWTGRASDRDEEWADPMLRVSATKTLSVDLLEQVHLSFSGLDLKIGEFLVQDLDSRGFLTRSLPELAADISAYVEEIVTPEKVASILNHLKDTLDPPGVCAASIEDSIALQLQRKKKSKWVDLIVQGYQLLAAGKERELNRLCAREGVDPSFVFDELEKLHFVPTFGVAEEAFDSNTIRPEVVITKQWPDRPGPEKYEIVYNNNAVVSLRLNPKIIEMARRRDQLSRDERQFLSQKVQKAKWLKQIVEDRRSLLLRTAEVIITRQWEFLDKGRRYLKPLTQREVADRVGRDESTISRLISGRYADTPQGSLPLSAFFSQAVGHSSGAAAREALKDIMDSEGDEQVYTDDELAEMMRRLGFAIQRRTVNKYRRMLGGHYALKRSVRRAMNRVARVG